MDDDDELPPSRVIRKPTAIEYAGWLWKKARKPQSGQQPFKARWFVLTRDRLLYFKSQQAETAIAEISLQEATVRVITPSTDSLPPAYQPSLPQRQFASTGPHVPTSLFSHLFEIDNKQRTYLLRANNAQEWSAWLQLLLSACRQTVEDNCALLQTEAELQRQEEDWAEREAQRVERLSVLRGTLRDPIACDYFIAWEVDRGREESVLCWLDCEGWREERSDERRRDKAREIWDAYVRRGGKREVRMDESRREAIRQAMEAEAADDWVDGLQLHAAALLTASDFSAFLLSSAFYHACMAATPATPTAPSSPSHHHAYAQARVGNLSRERAGGGGPGFSGTWKAGGPRGFAVGSAGRGRREQERLDDDDIVIVLSDDDDKAGKAAAAGGEGGAEEAIHAADEDGAAARGESGETGDGEEDYVQVRKNSYSEIVGGAGQAAGKAVQGGRGEEEGGAKGSSGFGSRSPPIQPRPQPPARVMSPVSGLPSAQSQLQQQQQQGPMQRPTAQTQHQQPQYGQQGGYAAQAAPSSSLVSPSSAGGQYPQQHQQPSQQQQKGGFFKRIFASGAAGEQQQPQQQQHQHLQQQRGAAAQPPPSASAPAPVGRDAAMENSTADALAAFYSRKPIAGAAVVTQPRPPPGNQPSLQQRQQQMRPQQQQPPQQQQQQQQYHGGQRPAAPLSQYGGPGGGPGPHPPPAAPSRTAAGAPSVDFSSRHTAVPVAPSGVSAAIDMFENLTIQGEPQPAQPAAFSPPLPAAAPAASRHNSPSAPAPPAAVLAAAPTPVSPPPAVKPALPIELDDDIFGPPPVPIPAYTAAATSPAATSPSSFSLPAASQPAQSLDLFASYPSSTSQPAASASSSSTSASSLSASSDPFADFYASSSVSAAASTGTQPSLDWAFAVPAASSSVQPQQRGMTGMGRGGAAMPGSGRGAPAGMMRGGMQQQSSGRGGPPQPFSAVKKKTDEDPFAAAYRDAQQRR